MPSVDEILALAEQEAGGPSATGPVEASLWKQSLYDIGSGAAKAGAGAIDLAGLLPVFAARQVGVPVEYFGTTKLLEKALEPTAEYLGVKPKTELQQLAEFVTPIPGAGKLSAAKQAVLGGLGYLGQEIGQVAAPGSTIAPILGSLFVPAGVTTVMPRARQLAKALSSQEIAQSQIRQLAGEEGLRRIGIAQEMPSTALSPLGQPLTAAEIAQSPELALAQERLAQGEVGASLQNALLSRQAAQNAALAQLGTEPQTGYLETLLREQAANEQVARQKAAGELLSTTQAKIEAENVAKQAAYDAEVAQKQAVESQLLEKAGLAPTQTKTPLERSAAIRQDINQAFDATDAAVQEAWGAVRGDAVLDVTDQLQAFKNNLEKEVGPITKSNFSSAGRKVIKYIDSYLSKNQGLITVDQYKDLRSAAGSAMMAAYAKAGGRTEGRQLRQLREQLDSIGEMAAPQLAESPAALEQLRAAIGASRDFHQTFTQGVTGQITKRKGMEMSLRTSQVLDRALANPENAAELVSKFGKDSVTAVEMRNGLLQQLAQAKNPRNFINDNVDTFQTLFKEEFPTVQAFAEKRMETIAKPQLTKVPTKVELQTQPQYAEYARASEATIPKLIYRDVGQAKKFVDRFKNTEAYLLARGKYIGDILKRPEAIMERLKADRPIAQTLFDKDFPALEKTLKDIESFGTLEQLAKTAPKGKQPTTVLGALIGQNTLNKAAQMGENVGYASLLFKPITAATAFAGSKFLKFKQAEIDEIKRQVLLNPSLLKLAAEPVSKSAVQALTETLSTLGIVGFKGADNSEITQASPGSTLTPEQRKRLMVLQSKL